MQASSLLRMLLRRRWRGSTRLTLFLARRISRLQSVSTPADHGSLFVDLREPSSHGLFAGLLPEADERSWLARIIKPGQTAFDVGAHWGLYTVLLASLVGQRGRVFAFEPCPRVLVQLRRTVALLTNTTLFEVGLSDRREDAPLSVPGDASMASFGPLPSAPLHKYIVATTSVEELIGDGRAVAPDFIKCDVEGAEGLVFRGARNLLDRTNAPVLLFEHNPLALASRGVAMEDTTAWLARLPAPQYRFFLPKPGGTLLPVGTLPAEHTNVIAVPESRRRLCFA
jgi:FkbM family methyltransferase